MNPRPPHEPSRRFPQPQRLWDDASRHARSLGCPTCLERDRCGGVHTDAGILDCRDLCSCRDRDQCDMVCRFNPSLFVARMREVGGLGFDNAPRVQANGAPPLPLIAPFVDHRFGRAAELDEPVVAISLYELVNLATGKPHVATRAALAERFRIPAGASIIVSGVDKDSPIERWWELKDRTAALAALKALGITLITTPNYSVLTDVPRTDNLHAMKRILLAWTEMMAAGLPPRRLRDRRRSGDRGGDHQSRGGHHRPPQPRRRTRLRAGRRHQGSLRAVHDQRVRPSPALGTTAGPRRRRARACPQRTVPVALAATGADDRATTQPDPAPALARPSAAFCVQRRFREAGG